MPPYFADPHIGSFKNDQGLTADQTKTLIHWIEAGAPRGTGRDALKEEAGEAPEWPTYLGKPDVIIDLPGFDVPASGIVEYQNMRVDNPFKEDAWLRAISIKPGDRSVLHHVVSNHMADPKLPKSKIPGGSVGSYTPGAEAQVIAKDAGAPVPAGGKLNFQMHYTTTGKAATDHTQVGFYTLKTPPKFIKRSTVIGDFGLKIPAGAARHEEISYQTFPADAYVYTLYPHSHYRGLQRRAESGHAGRQGNDAAQPAEVRLQLAARLRPERADPGQERHQARRQVDLRQLGQQPRQPRSEARHHAGANRPTKR